MSVNKVILVGHLGKDPEIRYSKNSTNTSIVNFSVATNERFSTRDGGPQERTEWHKVVVFGNMGDNCHKFLKKGSQVYIEGRIQTSDYVDKDGIKRYSTEIIATNVQFLDSRSGGNQRNDNFGNDRYNNSYNEPPNGGGYDGGYNNNRGGGYNAPPHSGGGYNNQQSYNAPPSYEAPPSYDNNNHTGGGNNTSSTRPPGPSFPTSYDEDDIPF